MLVQNCDCSCETAMTGLFDAISAAFLCWLINAIRKYIVSVTLSISI